MCSSCGMYHCQNCHVRFQRLQSQPQTRQRVNAMEELHRLEDDLRPIIQSRMDLAHQNSMTLGKVLSQENDLGRWVCNKIEDYAEWRRRWGLHHFRSVRFNGWDAVHTMACVLSTMSETQKSSEVGAASGSNNERVVGHEETWSGLTERWRAIFSYGAEENFSREVCTHNRFLKVSNEYEALKEEQVAFDASGNISAEVFDLLARKYEHALNSEDLTVESLQETRFSDFVLDVPQNDNNTFGPRIVAQDSADPDGHILAEATSPDNASDSASYKTSSVASSTTSSNVSTVSALQVGDFDGAQIDIEEILDNLLVKRQSLVREGPLTEEDNLVLETAWKMAQAIVYRDTPRPALGDIAEQGIGAGWYTAPGMPVESSYGGNDSGPSKYSTARSISPAPWTVEAFETEVDSSENSGQS